MKITHYANPARFNRLSARLIPWLAWPAGLLILAGLYFGLFNSPPDYQQGETVRIMYVHVPSAWMALFIYTTIAIACVTGLIWRHPLAFICARAAAPIGACFTFICLLTGSLWGKTMWGAWWVWDARLTSVLILLFLYIGFITLHQAFDDSARGERSAAILAIIGFINIPIIKFSVDWWNTLHQPASIFKMAGPSIHSTMLYPLFTMGLGFIFYFTVLLLFRMRTLMLERRVRIMRMNELHQNSMD